MEEKTLIKLLCEPIEKDWFEFKLKLKLYQADGKLSDLQRDELLKDILGLANGNSNIIRKTKYLIVGADDNKFDENGMRVLHDVDYKTPEQSELVKWLQSACSPAVVGVSCELIPINGVNLFVVTIPPTFDLHETTRELNASGHFQKYVVFMRQDEHTVPASVRDGVAIQQLKFLHRQEISNPSAVWIGAIAGGIVAYIIGIAKIRATQSDLIASEGFVQVLFTALGIFFGTFTGWVSKQWNETRYDVRYMTKRQRITLAVFVFAMFIVFYVLFQLG